MADMLVNLYAKDWRAEMKPIEGIRFLRPIAPNKDEVLGFVREHFNEGWANECDAAFSQSPSRCWAAVKDGEIIGFACYDATGRGYFGPTGVREDMRGRGIGGTLLKLCMKSMKEMGYGYAIIGWAADKAKPMYAREVGAKEIEGWTQEKSIYSAII